MHRGVTRTTASPVWQTIRSLRHSYSYLFFLGFYSRMVSCKYTTEWHPGPYRSGHDCVFRGTTVFTGSRHDRTCPRSSASPTTREFYTNHTDFLVYKLKQIKIIFIGVCRSPTTWPVLSTSRYFGVGSIVYEILKIPGSYPFVVQRPRSNSGVRKRGRKGVGYWDRVKSRKNRLWSRGCHWINRRDRSRETEGLVGRLMEVCLKGFWGKTSSVG